MKKFIAFCIAGVMLMSAPVFADGIVYDGEQIQYTSQQPVIVNSRTYVPIRDVFEKLGFDVEWDSGTKIVKISNDYRYIILTTGTSKIFAYDVYFNITAKKLENSVQIINGRTMLPLREILENAGYEIQWDNATKTTTIEDVNDYEALMAQRERFENFDVDSFEYKVNSSKQIGKLTVDEKAYLENLYIVLNGEKYERFGDIVDIDNDDPAVVKAAMKQFVSMVKRDIDSVECPESLKGVDSAVKKSFEDMADRVEEISHIGGMLEGETDDVKMQLGLSLSILSMLSIQAAFLDTIEVLNGFYAAGNIDPEAELGELYRSAKIVN